VIGITPAVAVDRVAAAVVMIAGVGAEAPIIGVGVEVEAVLTHAIDTTLLVATTDPPVMVVHELRPIATRISPRPIV
jgi:hypothetical protein